MNSSIIRYILGQVLKVFSLLLLLPCIIAVIYHEKEGFAFLTIALLCLASGFLMTIKKPANNVFYLKEGCITTALCWLLISIVGCIPFYLTGEFPTFIDAWFEAVSGITTTGSSVLSDVEALSQCTMFWRSFIIWIGGMGVLVFILAIVPLSGGSNINLMRAESPGPSVGKLVPKIKHTARILYGIYIFLTVVQFLFLIVGKMPIIEALNTSIATAGTGGFGIKNDSFASYSPYIQWVVTIFMLLFGVNFNAYYYMLYRDFKKAFSIEEVRYYFVIVIASIAFIFVSILDTCQSAFEALTHSSFQVATIITTCGFATTDFNTWSAAAKFVLVLLMFIGACAGSTGGGIKISRIVILIKSLGNELHSYIHPKSVKQIKFEGKTVEPETVHAINVYFTTFMVIFVGSIFLVSLEGKDLVTNFTAVAATLNNIGPGLELVGPTQNFGHFTDFTKLVLIFDMLVGRLELFPMLILFHPTIWKDLFTQKTAERKLKKAKKNNI